MKRPGFLEGAGVALIASIAATLLFSVLVTLFPAGYLLRMLIAAMGLVYLLYLLQRSGEKVGRISSVTLWLIAAVTIWLMGLSLPLYLLAHVGIIWLARSLYFYSSLISALADLGLVLLGLAAGVWAMLQSGSLLLSIWSFFLVQALFGLIPEQWKRSPRACGTPSHETDERFQQAYRSAQAALSKLSRQL